MLWQSLSLSRLSIQYHAKFIWGTCILNNYLKHPGKVTVKHSWPSFCFVLEVQIKSKKKDQNKTHWFPMLITLQQQLKQKRGLLWWKDWRKNYLLMETFFENNILDVNLFFFFPSWKYMPTYRPYNHKCNKIDSLIIISNHHMHIDWGNTFIICTYTTWGRKKLSLWDWILQYFFLTYVNEKHISKQLMLSWKHYICAYFRWLSWI